jgi:hypothetical protein
MIISILQYGSVLYACLGNVATTMKANCMAYADAEILIRKMLRWALRSEHDIRCSFLYVMSN